MDPVFRHFSLRAAVLRLAFVATACAAVAGAPARAENLEQAFALALNADGRLSASTRHVAAARSAHAAARGLRQPQVTVDALYYHLSEQPSFSVEILSLSTTLPFAQDRGWVYRAGVSVPLYTSGRIDRTEQAAQAGLDAAELGVQRTEQDIKLDVAHAYIGVLRAQRQRELAASGVATLEAHGRDAASFFEQGLVARNDMLAARSAVANARQDLIRATTMLDIARAGYNRQLGRALDDAVSIDELPQAKDNNASPVAAGSPRAELLALARQAQALRHQAVAARAATRPQLALSAGYDRLQNRYLDKDGSWNIGVGMHWSLFDGSISDNQADALEARADAVAHQRDDLESRIALQVRAAEMMVAESRSRIGVAETAIAQADENLRVARDRYQSGVGTHTDVLDAETLRLKSRSNHFNAIYDLLQSQQELKRARGVL